MLQGKDNFWLNKMLLSIRDRRARFAARTLERLLAVVVQRGCHDFARLTIGTPESRHV